MAIPVIVNGAAGRMGQTFVNLISRDPELSLAGAVERPGSEQALEKLGCPVSTDILSLLKKTPDAVVIDFTSPISSMNVAKAVRDSGRAAVIGTTGLKPEELAVLEDAAKTARIFWSPNMSVGVNTLLSILPLLVERLGQGYDLEIMEIHHNKKADAPSGTAIKLAQCLAEARGTTLNDIARFCREGIIGPRPAGELGVQTLRGGDVVGDHTIYFFGPGERIEITHRAHTRENFAQGALRAVKWIGGQKPGKLLTMADMLR
jgi:4-hydroxy-tetrahydrodipicolinate reductase